MRLVLAFVFLASPAIGGLPDYCLEAHGKGNEKDVARYAESILARPFPYRAEDARKGEECLLHYSGKEYQYSTVAQQFFLPEDREAGEAAALADMEAKKRARAEQERAEAERLTAEEQAEKDELERQEKLLELAAAQQAFRENLVVQRLGVACRNLYARSPDETIANKLCFDYFFANGLPD